jgi:hypothetical protein
MQNVTEYRSSISDLGIVAPDPATSRGCEVTCVGKKWYFDMA